MFPLVMFHLALVVLLAVDVKYTLSCLAGTTNTAPEWDILFIKLPLQHIGTHCMVLLTDVIVLTALVAHPTRDTRRHS